MFSYRNPPKAPDSSGVVKQIFDNFATDKFTCRLLGVVDRPAWLRAVFICDFRRSPIVPGGYAGFDESRILILALFVWPWRLTFVSGAIAAHELVHFSRHHRGITPFPYYGEKRYWYHRLVREEVVAWALGSCCAPFGTACVFAVYVSLFVVTPVYGANQLGHWLLAN